MDPASLNPLEVLRAIVAGFGLAIDLVGLVETRRRSRALWANQGIRIGRGHIMARSNVQTAALLIACHGTLLFVALQAIQTPDGPLSWLGVVSNVGQALVGLLLAAASVLLQNAQHDADIIDRRNAEVADLRAELFGELRELFDEYLPRRRQRREEG